MDNVNAVVDKIGSFSEKMTDKVSNLFKKKNKEGEDAAASDASSHSQHEMETAADAPAAEETMVKDVAVDEEPIAAPAEAAAAELAGEEAHVEEMAPPTADNAGADEVHTDSIQLEHEGAAPEDVVAGEQADVEQAAAAEQVTQEEEAQEEAPPAADAAAGDDTMSQEDKKSVHSQVDNMSASAEEETPEMQATDAPADAPTGDDAVHAQSMAPAADQEERHEEAMMQEPEMEAKADSVLSEQMAEGGDGEVATEAPKSNSEMGSDSMADAPAEAEEEHHDDGLAMSGGEEAECEFDGGDENAPAADDAPAVQEPTPMTAVQDAATEAKESVESAVQDVQNAAGDAKDSVVEAVGDAAAATEEKIDDLTTAAGEAVDDVKTKAKKAADDAAAELDNMMSEAREALADPDPMSPRAELGQIDASHPTADDALPHIGVA